MKHVAVFAPVVVMLALAAPALAQTKNDTGGTGQRARGFSVALVEGDLRADAELNRPAAGITGLPAVAEKALADMKDFLPYRQYRLLDMQWTRGVNRSPIRLQGADRADYEIQLQAVPGGDRTVRVVFELSEPRQAMYVNAQALRNLERDIRTRELELKRAVSGRSGAAISPERLELERQLAELRRTLDGARAELAVMPTLKDLRGRRPLIDTSFTMSVGETVVVGTSRLRADKALIVLLTAVESGAP
jgi:hypothetical protein